MSGMDGFDFFSTMMDKSPALESETESEEKVEKLTTDTEIMLKILEKVTCIEDRLGRKEHSVAPDPNVFGTTPNQLEL
jgi:hypothetical protein